MDDIFLVDGVSCNVYILAEPDGLTLIDTGMPGSARKIMAAIRALGRDPQEVRRILLTHQHVDHVGGAAELATATGAEVYAPPLDASAIEGLAPRELPKAPLNLVFRLTVLRSLKPVAVTALLRDGETLPVFGAADGLRVVATPGHTAGHVSLYLPARRLLFAGDAWRHNKQGIAPSPNIFNSDTPQALRSMASLMALDLTASLPGHGAPILRGASADLAAAVAKIGPRGQTQAPVASRT